MRFKYLQEGGPMPQGGGNPLEEIVRMAAEAVQSNSPDLAMQTCQALISLVQEAQQGGAPTGPEEPAPEGPAPEEGGEPVFRRGGRLLRRTR